MIPTHVGDQDKQEMMHSIGNKIVNNYIYLWYTKGKCKGRKLTSLPQYVPIRGSVSLCPSYTDTASYLSHQTCHVLGF